MEDSHYEVKCIDGLANMYLVVGAIIRAGLRGIAYGEVLPIKTCQRDPAELSDEGPGPLGIIQTMPTDIEEAMKCLEEDLGPPDTLG